MPVGLNPGFGDQDGTLREPNEPADGGTTRSDAGTAFTVAIEVVTSQRVWLNLYLQNTSGATATTLLQFSVPAGIGLDLADLDDASDGGANVSAAGTPVTENVVREARLSGDTGLLTVGAGAGADDDDGITVIIEIADDALPGFYGFTGRLSAIAGAVPIPE